MDNIYETEPIDDKTIGISEGAVRMFLLIGQQRAMLIDTGFGTGDLLSFVRELTKLPIITVNTHAHVDHVGCNFQFDTIYAHNGDFQALKSNGNIVELHDKDTIDLGGRNIEVIYTPGHSVGAISLLDIQNKMLFSGDNISDHPIFMFMEGQSLMEYVKSLERLLLRSNEYDSIYACHGTMNSSKEQAMKLIKCARAIQRKELNGEPTVVYDGSKCLCYKLDSATIYGN